MLFSSCKSGAEHRTFAGIAHPFVANFTMLVLYKALDCRRSRDSPAISWR